MLKFAKSFFLLFLFSTSLLTAREYTIEEKLSQMFMLGFKGNTPQAFNRFAAGNCWGGYIFYSEDAQGNVINFSTKQEAQRLLSTIKGAPSNTQIKPFLAIDMEGGDLQIARNKKGVFPFFAAPKTIAGESRKDKENWADGIVILMQQLGFNVNLGPVVDVDRAPYGNSRCFGNNAGSVVGNSIIFLDKHIAKKILCSLKHFPGRGSGKQTDIDKYYDKNVDLSPFELLVNQQIVGMVMISTKMFPEIDPKQPAHKSDKTLDLFRSMCKYQKVAITDDLSDFSSKTRSDELLEAEIVEIINAGNDMLLFANSGRNYDPNFSVRLNRILKNILKKRMLSEERIEESFRRILQIKQDHNIEPKEIYINYDI